MFGKLFAQTFTGSMFGAGAHVFAVWAYIIANKDKDGFVQLNRELLRSVIGCTGTEIDHAIHFLSEPDSASRSDKEDGRRIVQEGAYIWRVVNNDEYKRIARREHLRDYEADKKRRQRARAAEGCPEVVPGHPGTETNVPGTKTQEIETETEIEKEIGDITHDHPKSDDRVNAIPFDDFWTLYPKKVGKKTCKTKWRNLTIKKQRVAMAALPKHIAAWHGKDTQYIPNPATWLNQERWTDELPQKLARPGESGYYAPMWSSLDEVKYGKDKLWQKFVDDMMNWQSACARPTFDEWVKKQSDGEG